ncbi:peptidoglycan-binding domain-containing protein [Ralstonia pseudosolanacearum]|uniref:peptidoglycan-binding domain-containing protein n=1 Tax=Ralstonia pseudosolanacearum TaxID=1310165 RepID=UPI002E2124E3
MRELQHLLVGRGIAAPDTGEYDAATVEAVRVAQARFGLVVDGIAGPKTVLALRAGSRQPGHLTGGPATRGGYAGRAPGRRARG